MSSSIPPASTKFLRSKNLEHWKLEIGTIDKIQCGLLFYFQPGLLARTRAFLEHWPSGEMGMTVALFATFICCVDQRRQHFGQNLQLSF
jgi:hypothetical protein